MEKYITINNIKHKQVSIKDLREKMKWPPALRGCKFCSLVTPKTSECSLNFDNRPCRNNFGIVFMNKIQYIKVFRYKYNPYNET